MPFPENNVLDDFAGDGPLSASWTADPLGQTHPPGVRVGGALAVGVGLDEYYQFWSAEQFGANQEAYLLGIAGAGALEADGGVFLRLQNPGSAGCDGYAVEFRQELGTVAIYRITNGVYTPLGAAFSQVMADGDGIGGWCDGTTIRAYHHDGATWTLLGERIDTTYNLPGYIGCRLNDDAATIEFEDFGGGTWFAATLTASGVAVLGGIEAFGQGPLATFSDGRYAYLVDIEAKGHGVGADPAVVPEGTPHVMIPALDVADGIVLTYHPGLAIPLTTSALAAEIVGYGRGVDLNLCQTLTIPGPPFGRIGGGIAQLGNVTGSGSVVHGTVTPPAPGTWTFNPNDYPNIPAFQAASLYNYIFSPSKVTLETGPVHGGGTGKFFRSAFNGNGSGETVGIDVELDPSVRVRELWGRQELRFADTWNPNVVTQGDDKTYFVIPDYPGICSQCFRWDVYFRRSSGLVGNFYGGANDLQVTYSPFDNQPNAETTIFNGVWGIFWWHFRIPWANDGTGIWQLGWNNTLMHSRSGFSTTNTPTGSTFRLIGMGRNTSLTAATYRDWGRLRVNTTEPADWPF